VPELGLRQWVKRALKQKNRPCLLQNFFVAQASADVVEYKRKHVNHPFAHPVKLVAVGLKQIAKPLRQGGEFRFTWQTLPMPVSRAGSKGPMPHSLDGVHARQYQDLDKRRDNNCVTNPSNVLVCIPGCLAVPSANLEQFLLECLRRRAMDKTLIMIVNFELVGWSSSF